MKGRLLNLLTLLSLLLCVAVCVLWVRGWFVGEAIWSEVVSVDGSGGLHRRYWQATSGGGALDVYCVWGTTHAPAFRERYPAGTTRGRSLLSEADRQGVGRARAGRWRIGLWFSRRDIMSYGSGPLVWPGRSWRLIAPHWLVVTFTATLPALWPIAQWRRRARPGLCPSCGYDLRASPGRCPECGNRAKTPA